MARPGLYTHGPVLDGSFPLPVADPFTTARARDADISRSVLARLVRDGYLRRLLPSVYVAAQGEDSLWFRCKALRLIVPRGAVIAHRTAVWLWTGMLPFCDHLEVPPV